MSLRDPHGQYSTAHPLSEHQITQKVDVNSLALSLTDQPLQQCGVSAGDRIKVLWSSIGSLVVPSTHRAYRRALADYGVYSHGPRLQTRIFTPALEPLDVERGDSVCTLPCGPGFVIVRQDRSSPERCRDHHETGGGDPAASFYCTRCRRLVVGGDDGGRSA